MAEDSKELRCAKCGLQLPLILIAQSEKSHIWHCSNCGEPYEGVLDLHAPVELWGNVRRDDFPRIG